MVRQRKDGGNYYYQFIKDGKRYSGVCEGCSTLREAEAYEKERKATASRAAEQKSVRAFVENFREELTGGTKIALADAFELSLLKPRSRRPSGKVIQQKREVFRDFVAFMAAKYPDVTDIVGVLPRHAEEYITLVRNSGRFDKNVTYSRKGRTMTRLAEGIPSSRTVNLYLTVCAEVFRLLARDAGILDNPFSIPKLKKEEETREAFTAEELKLIYEHADDFTRPLFTVAIMTALREGDICTLKWSDIDFNENVIRRIMNKTRRLVEIPLSDSLTAFLEEQKKNADPVYVFPEHARMYKSNPTGVSYRIKQFLEGLGIQTTRTPEGRSRAVSVKDLHSCRHTFCYYAGMMGIPLAFVQSIVGHMTPEMTKHYSAHATLEDKRNGISKMGNFLDMTPRRLLDNAAEPERAELHALADSLPIEKVRALLAAAASL